jgi:hypothetical protein
LFVLINLGTKDRDYVVDPEVADGQYLNVFTNNIQQLSSGDSLLLGAGEFLVLYLQ